MRIMTFCALKQMIESSNVCSETDLVGKSKTRVSVTYKQSWKYIFHSLTLNNLSERIF